MVIDALLDQLPPLDTSRLRLRPSARDAAESIAAQLSPLSIPWRSLVEFPNAGSPPNESNLMEEPFSVHYCAPWLVELKTGRALAGACIFLTWSIADSRAELALALAPDLDQDHSTELLRTLIDFGFTRMELNRIEIRCLPSDTRMAALLNAAGMRHEATLRQQIRYGEEFHDVEMYSVIRDEGK